MKTRDGKFQHQLNQLLFDPSPRPEWALSSWLYTYAPPDVLRPLLSRMNGQLMSTPPIYRESPCILEHLLPLEHMVPACQSFQRCPGNRVLVCFTGNAMRMNIPVQLFHLMACPYFDRFVYLRDPSRMSFSNGITGIADSMELLFSWLERLLGPGNQIAVTSASGGGWGAIKFADRVQASRVALFSPPMTLREVPALSGRETLDPESVRLFFGAHSEFDQRLASAWRGTTFESSMRQLPIDGHGTLSFAVLSGQFAAIMNWLNGSRDSEPLKSVPIP